MAGRPRRRANSGVVRCLRCPPPMAWKRCPGCTRAISESANVCDYCGAPYVERSARIAGPNEEVSADLFDVDGLLDQKSLFAESIHLDEMERFNPADLPEQAAVSVEDFAGEDVLGRYHASGP